MNLQEYIVVFTAFVGVPALITVLINIFKGFGIVKDGKALAWVKWLNVGFFVGVYLVKTFIPEFDLAWFDSVAVLVSELGIALLAVIGTGIGVSGRVYGALKGIPLIGYSYTLNSPSSGT